MREDGLTMEEMNQQTKKETETIESNKEQLEELFAKGEVDIFFVQAVKYATSDPQNFSQFYKKLFTEKFPGKVLAQAPDAKLLVLGAFISRFTYIEGKPDFDKQKEQLLQQIKEAKEFSDLMEQRKREVRESSKKIFYELQIQEHANLLSEQEVEELIKNAQANIEDPHILRLLISYYLYTQGEFAMPNSSESKYLMRQDGEYINRLNERTKNILENPEELRYVLDVLSKKIRTTIEESNDHEAITATNQKNLMATPTCVLAEGDFLHGAPINTLDQVRKTGFLCREVQYPEYAKTSMSLNWGGSISFGRQTKDEIIEKNRAKTNYANPFIGLLNRVSFLGRYMGNVASEYGAYDGSTRHYLKTGEQMTKKTKEEELKDRKNKIFDIKAAGDDAITYVLREQKNSYTLDAGTATRHSDEHGVGIGVPSIEIKGVIIDATSEIAIKKILSELCKYSFYIPVYDSETGTCINEEMKKLYE
ncbi:MAG: hypothetical protein WC070_04645 [Candidatus Magasanikbacteria bacterium]